jgi:hypothetical protein
MRTKKNIAKNEGARCGGKMSRARASNGKNRSITDNDLSGKIGGERVRSYTRPGAHVGGGAAIEDPLGALGSLATVIRAGLEGHLV